MMLSIIIPTHNRAESLNRALESIVSLRDEVEFEFVIVDNNSTDNTKKVTENYSRIARYVFGGNTRPNTRSRYRQWLTHKWASWYDQYGTSGCVGCGRCITWCPAGIDHVEEITVIREAARTKGEPV